MKQRLNRIKNYLFGTLWVIPLLIIIFAILLSYLTISIDKYIDTTEGLSIASHLKGSVEGYREILSTIGSSMMTIAGIVFSSTLVALTMAANQFGPRILKNFMKDRLNQIVLGSYVATFLYCLLILRDVRPEDYISFTPDISVIVALILGVANIILLIFYIHHTAKSIQADYLISQIGSELIDKIKETSANEKYSNHTINNPDFIEAEYQKTDTITEIYKKDYGYFSYLDIEKLKDIAIENDLIIKFYTQPGDYVISEQVLAKVYTKMGKKLPLDTIENIADTINISETRSYDQDLYFVINQLIEIALRALSPGINDPHTAMACIDKLTQAITMLMKKDVFGDYIYDEDKNLRIEFSLQDFKSILDMSFGIIRQYATTSPDVLRHLHNSIQTIISLAELKYSDQNQLETLLHEKENIEKTIEKFVNLEYDKEVILNSKN